MMTIIIIMERLKTKKYMCPEKEKKNRVKRHHELLMKSGEHKKYKKKQRKLTKYRYD